VLVFHHFRELAIDPYLVRTTEFFYEPLLFNIPLTDGTYLDSGSISAELSQAFIDNESPLSGSVRIETEKPANAGA
jgi:hypothetical protein